MANRKLTWHGADKIDDQLWEQARLDALRKHLTMSQWLNDAIAQKLGLLAPRR